MSISLVWIKRDSDKEDRYLYQILKEIQKCKDQLLVFPEIIIVGRTQLDLEEFDLTIIFARTLKEWDDLGLLCHKKNIGVRKSTSDICIVMHSDVFIPEHTLLKLFGQDESLRNDLYRKMVQEENVLAPIAYHYVDKQVSNVRTFTWCDIRRGDRWKSETEPFDEHTYISGAVILGSKSVFLRFPWDETLSHNMEEDVEISKRIHNSGLILRCEPSVVLYMFEMQ